MEPATCGTLRTWTHSPLVALTMTSETNGPKWPLPADIYVNVTSRPIPRPQSPLLARYQGSLPDGCIIVGGVVTSANHPPTAGP